MSNLLGVFGDCHLGMRNGSHQWREYSKGYILDYMIPLYKSRGVKSVFGLGDLFDVRRSLAGLDMHWLVNELLPALEDAGITWHLIVGNHEISLLDSCEVNWPKWLERESTARGSNCVIAYDKPQDVLIGDTTYLAIPWVCKDNYDDVVKVIETTEATVVLAHLEIEGFLMGGSLCKKSTIPKSLFDKFELILTGHFHTSSKQKTSKGEFIYTGSPYPTNWGEFLEPAENGIYLHNTLTGQLEFIPNPPDRSMFEVLEYNYEEIASKKLGKKWLDKDYLNDVLCLRNKVVKINVTNRSNSKHYKDFLSVMRLVATVNYSTLDLTSQVETEEQKVTSTAFKLDPIGVILDKIESTEGEGFRHEAVSDKLLKVNKICLDKNNLI